MTVVRKMLQRKKLERRLIVKMMVIRFLLFPPAPVAPARGGRPAEQTAGGACRCVAVRPAVATAHWGHRQAARPSTPALSGGGTAARGCGASRGRGAACGAAQNRGIFSGPFPRGDRETNL